ncbi:MAG TPA: hypothetical protein VF174_02900 [Micromonosporaceae bacterium]
MSAPPEVVFNTATDPSRATGWLPTPLRDNGWHPADVGGPLQARWPGSDGWSAELWIGQIDAGGSLVRLELTADLPEDRLLTIADEVLAKLARHVADNLTAG